jgi:outer membrane lipoprotein-sorting protein
MTGTDRPMRRLALLLLALTCSTLPLAAQTVDELVAKNIAAKGGLERLRSINTIKQTSELDMLGTKAAVTVYGKRPNLLRQEIRIGSATVINAFDGNMPWMINPLAGMTSPVVVTGPQAQMIKEQANFDGPLVDYRQRGYTIDLVGEETLDGRPVEHLRITDRTQQVQECYLDAQTGLEAKLSSQVEGGLFEQELSDYRTIDGITLPFSIRLLVNGVQQSMMRVMSVQFNVPIDDRLFRVPR